MRKFFKYVFTSIKVDKQIKSGWAPLFPPPFYMSMLLYVVCKAGEFVWNEGGVVQLPAPYNTLCDILSGFLYNFLHFQIVPQEPDS